MPQGRGEYELGSRLLALMKPGRDFGLSAVDACDLLPTVRAEKNWSKSAIANVARVKKALPVVFLSRVVATNARRSFAPTRRRIRYGSQMNGVVRP